MVIITKEILISDEEIEVMGYEMKGLYLVKEDEMYRIARASNEGIYVYTNKEE